MNEVVKYLKSCGTFFLATDEDGQPHVRPLAQYAYLRIGFTLSRTTRKKYTVR